MESGIGAASIVIYRHNPVTDGTVYALNTAFDLLEDD